MMATADESDGGQDLMAGNRLLHAMLRVADLNATVDFWRSRGAKVLSGGGKVGTGATFIGFGEYRDTEHFALELAPTKEGTALRNTALEFLGLSMLHSPLPSPDAPLTALDPSGLVEVRSVAAAPGDAFHRFCLRTQSKENLEATVEFYRDVLRMEQVGMPSDVEKCFRYAPLAGGKLLGVPTALVFRVAAKGDGDVEAGSSAAGGELPLECFDHLAVSCRDVDAAFAHISGEGRAPVILEPRDMFGTRIMGLEDPNGYKVYLVDEAGFRAGATAA